MRALAVLLAAALQLGAPPLRPVRDVSTTPCVVCHQASPDTARVPPVARGMGSASLTYPSRYAPGTRVVLTRPHHPRLDMPPGEPSHERLIPRLERRKPAPSYESPSGTDD